jgi:acetyl esterase/lipase
VSLRAELQVNFYRLIREKHTWTNPKKLRREIRDSHQPKNERVPGWLARNYHVDDYETEGFPCYTVRRHGGGSGPHILHLHGGAYVQQISAHHWRFVRWLVEDLDAIVTVPLYPLAPEHTVEQTLPQIRRVYDRTLANEPPNRRVLMGDSAGGGMSLALAQRFRAEGRSQPGQIVLLSPWLDVTMTDPSVTEQDRKDPYLGASGLERAGHWYAGKIDRRDPRISPLFGDFSGLAPIAVFIGTRDVLLGDSRRLRDAATAAGVRVDYWEYPGMIHNWPMRRLPEGRRAREQITELLTELEWSGTAPDRRADAN